MWIVSKEGFISVVRHKDDPSMVRVRARMREHLVEWFPELEPTIIDHGELPSDYRWHLDVQHSVFAGALLDSAAGIDYTSHAKEAMSHGDGKFYSALMRVWSVFMDLQGGRRLTGRGRIISIDQPSFDWDDEDELLDEEDEYADDWNRYVDELGLDSDVPFLEWLEQQREADDDDAS